MIKREASFIAGMPNLALCGLSENWLLKECGNQHWLALAELFDQPLPDFKGADGAPVYAAFVAVELKDLALYQIDENDTFRIETHLTSVGKARFYSNHSLSVDGHYCGSIKMLSTQVSRKEAGNNQSVVRIELPVTDSPESEAIERLKTESTQLLCSAKGFRLQNWMNWHEMQSSNTIKLPPYSHFPCPNNDFNGADFLYFANFQAAADRAEWAWNRNRELWQVTDRQLNYYGNINIGDALHLEFSTLKTDKDILLHCLTVSRDSDGNKIADIVTRKTRLIDAPFRWAQGANL